MIPQQQKQQPITSSKNAILNPSKEDFYRNNNNDNQYSSSTTVGQVVNMGNNPLLIAINIAANNIHNDMDRTIMTTAPTLNIS